MHRPMLLAAILCAAVSAQTSDPDTTYRIPGTDTWIRVTTEGGVRHSAVSRDGGATFTDQGVVDTLLHLRYGTFDPRTPPAVPAHLAAPAGSRLFVVQFGSRIVREFRAAVLAAGGELKSYLPSQSYLVRMDRADVARVAALPFVRAVLDYHLAFRLEPEILAGLDQDAGEPTRYTIVAVDKRADAAGLERAVAATGAEVVLRFDGGLLMEATMNRAQLLAVAADDRVAWIDRSSAPEEDIDNARRQGGTDYIEAQAGIAGKGMRGHVMEGVYSTHPEFAARPPYRTTPIGVGNSSAQDHGNATAGEVYGMGARAGYKGLMPYAQLIYTNYSYVYNQSTRYGLTRDLVDPNKTYNAMLQTASWGYNRTLQYTSRSAEMDDIIFDLDLYVTQSQSNAGSTSDPRMSRPQAWAKNIVSVGGFRHGNNANAADDYWGRSGSTGPAADGRIGVTLAAFYDSIQTTGYGATAYTTSFGGTSGATPIVNGLSGNIIEMFTEGMFGYGKTPDWPQRTLFLPHFSTTKALAVATAKQLPFDASGTARGANRYQQGFGFPSVAQAYDERDRLLVIDELDVLQQGQARSYYLWTPGGREFHAAMNYPDPPASPNATIHRINSVDLKVETADGRTYHGNNGLLSGNYSTPGGGPNDRDTEESVILQEVPAGLTTVTVSAPAVRMDGHVETPAPDVDYALVVRGAGGLRDRSGLALTATTGNGGLSVGLANVPASGWAHGYTLFSRSVARPVSTGNVLGLEFDGLAASLATETAAAGNVFHFLPTPVQGLYPNAAYRFPAALAAAIHGLTFDAVAVLFDARGAVVGASNVERFTVE